MTASTKRSVLHVTLILIGVFLMMLLMTTIGWLGRASAGDVAVDVEFDPVGTAMQVYQYVRDGSHLPAVGAVLMLVVWAMRAGLGKVHPWFKKPIGGYLIGFGSATLAFVGPAFIAGQAVTIGLITQAIGTGFAASGKWEGLRDAIAKMKKAPVVPPVALLLILTLAGCNHWATPSKTDVLDCTKGELAALPGVVPLILPTLGEKPDWKVISAQLEGAGTRVATCMLANLVDRWKSNLKLATPESNSAGDQALAELSAKNGFSKVVR
jgi:hypothetical protein